MNAKTFNPGFTSYFNIGYLDVNRYLRTNNQMTFVNIDFGFFSYFNIGYLNVNRYRMLTFVSIDFLKVF